VLRVRGVGPCLALFQPFDPYLAPIAAYAGRGAIGCAALSGVFVLAI
jgi:hypothetical protein